MDPSNGRSILSGLLHVAQKETLLLAIGPSDVCTVNVGGFVHVLLEISVICHVPFSEALPPLHGYHDSTCIIR